MTTNAARASPTEEQRLAELRAYAILDTPAEPAFDRLARLASDMLDMPMAAITLIDHDRLWFKARVGLEQTETDRLSGFCTHAIQQAEPLIVQDAHSDRRFCDMPFVKGEPGIRFYAGAPLCAPTGFRLGAICVIDRRPRRLSARQRRFLVDLAALVIDEMELRRQRERAMLSEARLRSAIEHMPFGFWVRDRDGRLIHQNAFEVRLWGDHRNTTLQETDLPVALVERFAAENRRALAGEHVQEEFALEQADGRRILEKYIVPVRTGSRIDGLLGMTVDITDHKNALAAARASEQRLQDFAATSSDWLWETDAERRFTYFASNNEPSTSGLDLTNLIGSTRQEIADPATLADPAWHAHRQDLAARRPFHRFRYCIVTVDGRRRYFETSGKPIFDAAGMFVGYRGSGQDVTETIEALHQAERAEALLRDAIDSMSDGLILWDEHERLVLCNQQFFERLLPGLGTEVRLGETLESQLHRLVVRGIFPDALVEGESWARRHLDWHRRCAAEPIELRLVNDRWLRVGAHRTREGGIVTIFTEITELKQRQAAIQTLADQDPLTGLPNRRRFRQALDAAMARSSEAATGVALIMLDLDRFKFVNDTLGHYAGDRLLCEVAGRLRSLLRDDDLLARLGGDEFAVLLEKPGGAVKVARIVERIRRAMREPVVIEGEECHVSFSLGVARFPEHAGDAEGLARCADIALYNAKHAGPGDWRPFDETMLQRFRSRRILECDLRQAIARRELVMHYQPVVEVASGRITSFEALIRWQHPERGLVRPDLFLPVAEETGLIRQIGPYVLERVAEQLRAWLDAGFARPRVAVNIAAGQFIRRDLSRHLFDVMRRHGLTADNLAIEITEGVFLGDSASIVREELEQLSARGIAIALDDFGTGYASLTHLREYPISAIKVDKSFVIGISEDSGNAAIVRSVAQLAKGLGLEVVAEGVEGEAELDFVREHGCAGAQGYHFAPALPPEQAAALLSEQPFLRRSPAPLRLIARSGGPSATSGPPPTARG